MTNVVVLTIQQKLQQITVLGFKTNKEKITVVYSFNVTGTHKFPLLVYYKSQKSALMDGFLFREWFKD